MICPDCERPIDAGTVRCPCGALVGHVARRPVQESIPDRGIPAPAKRARIAEILTGALDRIDQPRRDPVEHWKKVLETGGLADISYRYAREALAIIDRPGRKVRERQPGEDYEEDAFQ